MNVTDFINAVMLFEKMNLPKQKAKAVKALELMIDKGIEQLEAEVKAIDESTETEEAKDAEKTK